ncbi:MAG: PTS transporter subunit EIIC [Bacillota bacterium]
MSIGDKFLSFAVKVGSQRHLVAIRDAFIGIMPVTMAGSIAVLLNVFFRDLPTDWGMTSFVESMAPLISVNGNVWWGSMAIISMVFVFALGYCLCNSYEINPLAGGVVAFSSFVVTMPQATAGGEMWGYIGWGYTNATGLFTAMLVGLVSSMIFVKLTQKNIIIKLPDSVPPAVNKAFAAIVPGTVAIYLWGIIGYLCVTMFDGMYLNDIIVKYVQGPFLNLSQGYFSVLITTVAVSLFWFFGLHGTNVLGPVLDGTYLPALMDNITARELGQELPYIWTRGSFDAFAWQGGAGCTIALLIAILLVGKLKGQRAVAKIAAPMGAFNINEPVMFGIPIVLNPIYGIPFVIVPAVLVTIAYFATAMGIIPPVCAQIPWVIPPVIYAYLATGGSIMAGLVSLINLIIGIAIWGVFVLIANKKGEGDEMEEAVDLEK